MTGDMYGFHTHVSANAESRSHLINCNSVFALKSLTGVRVFSLVFNSGCDRLLPFVLRLNGRLIPCDKAEVRHIAVRISSYMQELTT